MENHWRPDGRRHGHGSQGRTTPRSAGRRTPRIKEIPFDSERKRMTTAFTVWSETRRRRCFPVLARRRTSPLSRALPMSFSACANSIWNPEKWALSPEQREMILGQNREMASDALRVLAVAYRPFQEVPTPPEAVETDLVFVGLLGMIDPPRPEVIDALKSARRRSQSVSWSPATTRTPLRRLPATSAC